VINEDVNAKPLLIGAEKMQVVTPFHRSDIEYISKSNYFYSDTRKAYIFATTKNDYGYRCFKNQVFQQDVLIPNKSIHFVEDEAENWAKGTVE
jgi:hypothetical protein